VKHSTRSRRIRQRPRTGKIQRHQDQPMLWPEDERPVFRNRQVRLHVQQRGEIAPYGGLSLAHDLAMRLGIDRDINDFMEVLRLHLHLPYFDSDHLLTHVYNQYAGGSCIEDIAHLQHSDAVKHLTGACRIPDPSTAGDFLRRDLSRRFTWSGAPSSPRRGWTRDDRARGMKAIVRNGSRREEYEWYEQKKAKIAKKTGNHQPGR